MSGPTGALATILLGYVVGAVPVGLIAGWLAGGVDLRQQGSRRTGATNALRALGPRWAAAVFLLDVVKGLIAVLLARAVFAETDAGTRELVAAAAGLGAVIGHNWSVFIGLRGGRGVATTVGGLLALAPLAVLLAAPFALGVTLRTRYVSAGSLTGAAAAVFATLLLVAIDAGSWAAVGYALLAGTLVFVAHRDNIGRLRAGTERKLGERDVRSTHEPT